MKKLFLISLVALALSSGIAKGQGEYQSGDCCKDAYMPEICNETECEKNNLQWQSKEKEKENKKLYNGQYNSCIRALDNAKEVNAVKIGQKKQTDYCKCVAEQMVERYDKSLMANLVQKDLSNMFFSMIDQYIYASMSFCDTEMNLQIIQAE